MYENLKLKPIAIGSLPHCEAMKIVEKNFSEIPFFPQLTNVSKNEDMIIQVLEGFPGVNTEENQNLSINSEDDSFYTQLENFFTDYEEIIADSNSPLLDKYRISENFSSTVYKFFEIIRQTKPLYAKGQLVGPFTLATALTDNNGTPLIFDETLRDIVVKHLSLKAIWLIKQIKHANPDTTPIIFTDEPSVSQLGTSAYVSVSTEIVEGMLKEIIDVIHSNGALSGVHCCGKCNWSVMINAGTDIINPDVYSFAEHFALYADKINGFLQNGGKIMWGIVPTLDADALRKISTDDLVNIFENSVNYLTKKGINEKLITDNSLISSSCGAGSLTEELAERAMDLIKDLSDTLREKL